MARRQDGYVIQYGTGADGKEYNTPAEVISNADILTAVVNESTAASNEIVAAAGAGKKIRVFAVKLVAGGAVSTTWQTAATALEGAVPHAANGGYTESVDPPAFLFETAANEALNLLSSGAVQVSGRVSYWIQS